MARVGYIGFLFLLLIGFHSCTKTDSDTLFIDRPSYFPAIPNTDVEKPTQIQWRLGERLFKDRNLSRTGEVSCADCHQSENFFADGRKRSIGVEGREGLRSAPSLLNTVYHESFFWDGGSRNLEGQALAPFDSWIEFDLDFEIVRERLM